MSMTVCLLSMPSTMRTQEEEIFPEDLKPIHLLAPKNFDVSLEDAKIELNEKTLGSTKDCCQVCGDTECAKHYGSVCCSGCKGFFRRTVRFNKVYECPYANNCDVSKESRNTCKACRFDKCIKVGMSPLMLRGDRKKKNSQSSPHSHPEIIESFEDDLPSDGLTLVPKNFHSKGFTSEPFTSSLGDLQTETDSIIIACKYFTRNRAQSLGSLDLIPSYNSHDFQSITRYYLLVEKLCDTYSEINMTHLCKDFDDKCSLEVPQSIAVKEPGLICYRTELQWDPKFRVTSDIFKYIWCRCASVYFDWASHVRELKKLSEQDQEILLVGKCISSVWLMMGYKSVERKFNGVVFGGGSYFPGDTGEQAYLDKDMLFMCKEPVRIMMEEFVKPAVKLKVTEAEYTLLRVICLLSPVPGLSSETVQKLQKTKEKYVNALSEVVRKSHPHLNVLDALNRISNLIMLISVAERVAEIEDNNMSLMSLFNIAQIRGTLPYDIHIRRYNPTANAIKYE